MNQFLGERFFYEKLDKSTDKIITISNALKSKLERYIPSSKIKLIYDDVHIKNKKNFTNRFTNKKVLRILVAGTICEGKGQRFVIDSLDEFKNHSNLDISIELGLAGVDKPQIR